MWDSECEITGRQLLQCVVEVAQAAFHAQAASVFLIDEDSGDLVFEAVSGQGEEHLVGTRFPAGTGIAGWVVSCGQALITDDLDTSAQFSKPAAEATGYVPKTLAAAPLFRAGECIGVLEVLDRGDQHDELGTLDLLGLLASQAALGLELLQRVRRQSALRSAARDEGHTVGVGAGADEPAAVLDRITAGMPHLSERETWLVGQMLQLAGGLSEAATRSRGI
ncbi:GAF domain-containing protein [Streptacidiphilus rugosus]|uniref:GAF domain-containing protein n=1 Tax=Streptacidiphilus rugosus TaxID=405783 RepID=UPI0006922169|nr:GAF domain-containing protein [Streptacidiphilus rugosus]